MGRCPEDGQTVLFEAKSEPAVDFFNDIETNAWQTRLAHLCSDVHAIYTPELSCDFTRIARAASCSFGESYFAIVCDEPQIAVWKDGHVWLANLPPGRKRRQMIRQIEETVFEHSNRQSGGDLWKIVDDFVWGDFGAHDFVLEK